MIYSLLKLTLTPIFRLFYRLKVSGTQNIPKNGPVLLVSNHASYLDPIVLGVASPRPVAFMAKEDLFGKPVLSWIIRQLRSFPVKRGSVDRRAIRTALEKLKSGEMVGIFPQGTRVRSGANNEGLPGAAMIARKSEAIIVPTAILGTEKVMPGGKIFPRWPKLKVRFGRPMKSEGADMGKEGIAATTNLIMGEIESLLSDSQ